MHSNHAITTEHIHKSNDKCLGTQVHCTKLHSHVSIAVVTRDHSFLRKNSVNSARHFVKFQTSPQQGTVNSVVTGSG